MTSRLNIVVGLAVLLGAGFFGAGLSSIDDQGGYAGLSPRFVPILVTIALALCGLLLMVWRDSVPDQVQDGDGRPMRVGGFAWVLGGLVLDLVLIGTLGFVLASCVLMLCVARGYGSHRPLRDLGVALALTVPLWLLFAQVLGISMPLLPALGI